jgi:DNA-directed RNA polymerase specialized sigma24 family protein
MTEDLGVYIKKIATGLSFLPSFINYTYKEDMIGDALVKMYNAVQNKKYDFSTGSNPFSYFTTIAFHAFINRIKKEKKHHDTINEYKSQMYQSMMTDPEMSSYIYVKPEDEDEDGSYNQNHDW